MQALAELISTVGFPVFVAVYVLIRLEHTIKGLQKSITIMTVIFAKTNGIDYNEAKKLVGNGNGDDLP